jgi:ZIP family zinc transporter
MTALALSFLTFVSTALGGLLALKFRDRLHHLLGFTAGVMLGVVAFDLLPEVFELSGAQGENGLKAMVALVAGFLLFHALEKFVLVHTAHEEEYAHHAHPHVGVVSALALISHSFLDGAGIGLAFQVSDAAGITVALAVIAHDFCDGLNTVGLMLLHRNKTSHSVVMLLLDALAPCWARPPRWPSPCRRTCWCSTWAALPACCSTSAWPTSCPRRIPRPGRARRCA